MSAIGDFVNKHPFLTFFLAGTALYTVQVIARGYEPPPPPPKRLPSLDDFVPDQTQLQGLPPEPADEPSLVGYSGYGNSNEFG